MSVARAKPQFMLRRGEIALQLNRSHYYIRTRVVPNARAVAVAVASLPPSLPSCPVRPHPTELAFDSCAAFARFALADLVPSSSFSGNFLRHLGERRARARPLSFVRIHHVSHGCRQHEAKRIGRGRERRKKLLEEECPAAAAAVSFVSSIPPSLSQTVSFSLC